MLCAHADAVRREHDQIHADLHRVAHDFMRTATEDDLLTSRHMAFIKVSAEFRQMVPGRLLDTAIEIILFSWPDARNQLDDMTVKTVQLA
jgi:hypothetical protein